MGVSTAMDSGQKRLQELGYKQELKRDLSYVRPDLRDLKMGILIQCRVFLSRVC